jgi:hypothetical protein
VHGPEQEVIFEQRHQPGERAQSDFTQMEDLGVTIAGEPFPHMVYHFVLTSSNAEAACICFSETFEALAEGIEKALWQLGGVPEQHRTDHLSAAVRQLRKEEREDWTLRYQALMQHYGMQPTWNNTGVAHENGDVEQSHYRFKQAVDQALRVRWSRDFSNRAAYEQFLQDLVSKRNQTRDARFTAEKEVLRPLPAAPLSPCKELRVTVSRFSTIHVGSTISSVPSPLIGTAVMIRVRAETLEGYVGTSPVFILPRLVGKHKHRIDSHPISRVRGTALPLPPPLRTERACFQAFSLKPFERPLQGAVSPQLNLDGNAPAGGSWDAVGHDFLFCRHLHTHAT